MIDISEELISLRDVSSILPTRPCYETVWRWWKYGYKGVRLEGQRAGRGVCTSREALQRFMDAVESLEERPREKSPARASVKRGAEVEERLKKKGLM